MISDAGVRGLLVHVRAEGYEIADDRLVAEAGLPMAKAATVTADAGLSGLEFGLAIPGNVGGAVWANAGAHASDVAAVLESAAVLAADGSEARLDAGGLGLGYRESRLKHAAAGSPPEVVLAATFRLAPRGAGPDPRAARRDPPLAPRAPAARDPERRQRLPEPDRGPSAGALIDGCGLKGRRAGRRGGLGAARQLDPQRSRRHARPTSGASASDVRATVERETGVRLAFEVVFMGDWSGWTEEAA